MKSIVSVLIVCGGLVAAGCGQKGPLYLPDQNAAVVTRPAGTSAPTQPAPGSTTPPLPPPEAPSPQQPPQGGAPPPPPSPTTEGTTTPKPQQDKDKDNASPNAPPRS